MTKKIKQTRSLVRQFLLLGAIVFAMAPNLAGAEVVEFQVHGESISQLVGDSLIAEGFCPVELDFAGSTVDVDMIETRGSGFAALRSAGSTQTFHINPDLSLSGAIPQLVIPLTIHVKNQTCMEEPECDEHSLALDVEAFVNLSMSEDQLCGEFAGFSTVLDPVAEENIRDQVGLQCMSIDLSMIASMLGDTVMIGSGVTVSDSGMLAVRIEYGSELSGGTPDYAAADTAAWNDFLSGDISPNDHPEDGWSLFIDHRLMTDAMIVRIEEQLSDVEDFTLSAGASDASWTARADQARMDLNSYGEADLCSIDVTIRTGIDMFLGDISYLPEGVLPADALMVSEGNITIDKDTGETLGCAALLSLAGMGLYPEFFSVWGIISGIIRSVQPSLSSMDEDALCENVGETGFRCVTPINFPTFGLSDNPSYPHAEMSVERLYGHGEGLILSGAFTLYGGTPPERITGDPEPFVLDTGDHCCNERVALRAHLSVFGSGDICGEPEEISDDPLGVYRVTRVLSGGGSMGNYLVEVLAGPDNEFWLAPYDLIFRVKSTAGMMAFQFNAPPEPGSEEWDSAYSECSAKHRDCVVSGMIIYDGPEFNLPPEEMYSIDPVDEKEVTTIKDIEKDTEVESKVIISTETEKDTTVAVKDTDMVLSAEKVVSTDAVSSSVEESTDTSSTKTKDVESDDRIAADTSVDSVSSTASSYADTSADTKITVSTATK